MNSVTCSCVRYTCIVWADPLLSIALDDSCDKRPADLISKMEGWQMGKGRSPPGKGEPSSQE